MADELELDLFEMLGATTESSRQQLTLYIPDKDRGGNEIGTQRQWVLDAAHLLARIGGGVTIMPAVEGGWYDEKNKLVVWERPVIVYTYVDTNRFIPLIPDVRRLVHKMGRETNQGEVIVEFDGIFYRITEYEDAQ